VSGEAGLLRVLTWNIHRGIGPDGRYDLGRVVELIRRHDPDIVALQEIDSRGRVHGAESPLAFLTGALGRHVAEARTILAADGHYGHALISRWPLSSPLLHDISVSRREPRFAIEATAATAAGPIHLAAVHLGVWIGERKRQARRLAQIADSGAALSVMLGDFNDWPWRGVVRRTLAAALPGRTRHRTFPAWWPLLRLDRVYCRPPQALVRSWTDPAGRRASDHLPVIAEIRMPRLASPAAR
jgi:endonuclease/exonuclease/phosphatase family metal-dependent hydrolase